MSIDRKEPTLSNPNSMPAEKRPPKPGASANPAAKRAVSRSSLQGTKVIVKKEPSSLLWLTFFIALAASFVAALGFWQLNLSQQMIGNQQQRIVDLETKLELTGDESAQSLTSLAANMKELKQDVKLALSEVDKLWGTRNVNRKAIGDNQKAIEASGADIKKDLTALENKLNEPVQSLQQRYSEQELLIQSLRERLSEQEKTLSSVSDELKVSVNRDSLNKVTKELNRKIQAHDEAIQSMDKFRLTVNRDLLTLKQRSASQPAPQ